jgi:hypothetical protein
VWSVSIGTVYRETCTYTNTHRTHFDPEDGGSIHLRSVSNINSEPPWRPKISNLQLCPTLFVKVTDISMSLDSRTEIFCFCDPQNTVLLVQVSMAAQVRFPAMICNGRSGSG